MDRRTFLTRSLYAASAVGGVLATSLYLNDQSILTAPTVEGYVLCDLHAHLRELSTPQEELLATLRITSPGVVGITGRTNNAGILTYEKAVDRLRLHVSFSEIAPGRFCRFGLGYALRTQEINVGTHHMLAIGIQGEYLPSFDSIDEAVDAIHQQDGLAVLAHPYTVANGFTFRLAKEREEDRIRSACAAVDLVEVHNGQNVNLIPGFMMAESNKLAASLAETQCYGEREDSLHVIASSDAHHPEQIKTSGVYVAEDSLESIEALKEALQTPLPFHAGTVSRGSFIKGLILPRLRRTLGI